MFGYVTFTKNSMTEDEYNTFLSYYCGLCRETGRECSGMSRLGLSYDITFLAIVLSAIDKEDYEKAGDEAEEFRCALHPKTRRKAVINNRNVRYAANMGTLLTYLKLYDDWKDDRSVKAVFGMAGLYGGMKRAKKRYPRQYDIILDELKRLDAVERASGTVDEAADCFAKILECLFDPDYITDEQTKKIARWFGYNLGRWIYVIDAYNDIETDLKKKNYNPFLVNREGSAEEIRRGIRENTEFSLTLNLEAIASAYDLFKVYRNDAVIKHVLYTELISKQDSILGEKNGSL